MTGYHEKQGRKVSWYRFARFVPPVLMLASGYVFFYLGYTQNRAYYLGFALWPLLLYLAYTWQRLYKKGKRLAELKAGWGRAVERERNFESLFLWSGEILAWQRVAEVLDRFSWDDLHLNSFFSLLDRTFTTPGEQVLYSLLRSPLMDKKKLEERRGFIDLFARDEKLRETVQLELDNLGRQQENLLTSFLFGDGVSLIKTSPLPGVLALASLLVPLLAPFLGMKVFFYVMMPLFFINSYVLNHFKRVLQGYLPTISYLRMLIYVSARLGDIPDPRIKHYAAGLKKAAANCSPLMKKTRLLGLGQKDATGIFDYLNILFLIEIRSFFASLQDIKKHLDDLSTLYQLLGELDALISVASFRSGFPGWTEPQFAGREAGLVMEMKSARHPLIENAVANDVGLNGRGAIVTGSNMSGKSTFLRTVGMNVLFAQTILTVFSQTYRAPLFRIMTSINKSDDLLQGKSYFLAEAQALLAVLERLDDRVPSLVIVDEIFRGTNSRERIPAAIEFLRYLSGQNALVLVATHDLEIAGACADLYSLYHFSEDVGSEGLIFDFRLKPGPATTSNAVRILQHLGFPAEITQGALARLGTSTP